MKNIKIYFFSCIMCISTPATIESSQPPATQSPTTPPATPAVNQTPTAASGAASAQPAASTQATMQQPPPPQKPSPAQTPVQSVKAESHAEKHTSAEVEKRKVQPAGPQKAAAPATSIKAPPPLHGPVVSTSAAPIPQEKKEAPKTPVIPPVPPAPLVPKAVVKQPTAALVALPVKKYPVAVANTQSEQLKNFRALLLNQSVDNIVTLFNNSPTVTQQTKMDALTWLINQSGLSNNDKILLLFKLAPTYRNKDEQAQIYNLLTNNQLAKGDPILYVAAENQIPLDGFIAWQKEALQKNPQSPLAHIDIKALEYAIQKQDPQTFATLRRYFPMPKDQATRLLWLVVNADKKPEFVPLLKGMQADVNAINNKQDQQTPLMLAAENGNVGMVTQLLDNGADASKKDHLGRTAAAIANEKKGQVPQKEQGRFIDIVTALDHEQNFKK